MYPAKKRSSHVLDMDNVCCLILGGGQGTRLHPLTLTRSKPAISFGGRYRLIDVPISNAVNSHIHKIFVVTQFLSSSLHRHIFQTYHLSTFSQGFIEVLTAEQKPEKNLWYQGTADAVRQNIEYLLETPAEYFLILSGDQLYHMEFQRMIEWAIEKDADVVVAALPVAEKDATRMGIMKINNNHAIVDFAEKPKDPAVLAEFNTKLDEKAPYLASMGIYLFKRKALFDLLQSDPRDDFGKHLIPSKVKTGSIFAYPHEGYWEDIGTIDSYHKANIALTSHNAPFNFYNENAPIYSARMNLPSPKILSTEINNAIIADGVISQADEVSDSILGPRTVLKRGAIIRSSYIIGNDFYEAPHPISHLSPELFIDENAIIKNAIIDKNVHIGKNVQLINKNHLTHYDSPNAYIRDGIIVIPQGAVIPNNFVL